MTALKLNAISAFSLGILTTISHSLIARGLTRPFHLDRALLLCRFARLGEQGALGTPPGGILLRDASAAEQDDVTITFYQLQKGCDHHVLSAADQQERPSAVKTWSYLHVDQLPSNFTALYLMNNFDHHVLAAIDR